MLLLPLPAYPAYNVITTIDGVDYELVYTYDEHRDLWRFGINDESGNAVMGHRPLLPFVQMRPNAFASALEGVFALIAPLPTDDAYEALTGGLWSVVYGLPAEIAELTDSLSDLAGDADTPVVPIDVIYPPNNAILSNPVVTFSGTGPANQLLFARGESIQVDSMGSWVWTHAFSESNPVVVFEGESGQRATVRFSIIMQPLLINPVGEDIDGTRYAFTESVEVTGTATPNSTITVNGQPVSVGGDGLWSTVPTLSAGQSHTITAIGADGQIAQTSVYVWGEQDLMALEPDVWLDPVDASMLFVNAEGTIPATIGDPVGLWVNKGTLGSDGDAKQPVSASRPVWDNGVLDMPAGSWLRTSYVATTPFEVFVVARQKVRQGNAWAGIVHSRVFGGNVAAGVNNFALRINNRWAMQTSMGNVAVGGTQWANVAQMQILNGRVSSSETVISYAGYAAVGAGITITSDGAGTVVVGNIYHDFEVMGVFIFDRILTDQERVQLVSWMEAQHGI